MHLASHLVFFLITAAFTFAGSSEVRAQDTGAVVGRVLDAADSTSLPGVNVVARQNGAVRGGASTDAEGRFRIEGLPPGAYRVEASAVGFAPEARRVDVAAGQSVEAMFRLEAAAYDLSEIVVRAERESVAPSTVQRVEPAALRQEDAAAVAEVMRLVPAAHVQTNSRGETLVYLRSAGERQTALFFNGALLNVPWDNRVDLGLLPAGAIGGMTVAKGVPSVLYGTNVLGGAVNATSRALDADGQRTEVSGSLGAPEAGRAQLTHLGRRGAWSYTASAGYAAQDGAALPRGADLPFSQRSSDLRTNTDRRIAHAFAEGRYAFEGGARIGISALHIDSEQGVAPQSNRDPAVRSVRFWRYPVWRRSMLIVSGTAPLGAARLRGAVWGSRFAQDIAQYRSAAYDLLEEEQHDENYTLGTRLVFRQPLGPGALQFAVNALTSRHDQQNVDFGEGGERLPFDSTGAPYPTETYRQSLFSLGAEYDAPLTERLTATVGASFDGMAIPETAGKPERDPFYAYGLTSGLVYRLSERVSLKGAAGRKVRFPTMRELYGAALGRFVVNPGLRPESALLAETGVVFSGTRFAGEATVFLNRTYDTISTEDLPDGRERRINLRGSRVAGVEVAGEARPIERITARGHLTWMHGRGFREEGTRRLDEKPAWLGTLTLSYDAPGGVSALVQPVYTRGAYALEGGEFVELPASLILNARIGYDLTSARQPFAAELFARADNLTDAVRLAQPGLPAPGRELRAGLTVTF